MKRRTFFTIAFALLVVTYNTIATLGYLRGIAYRGFSVQAKACLPGWE